MKRMPSFNQERALSPKLHFCFQQVAGNHWITWPTVGTQNSHEMVMAEKKTKAQWLWNDSEVNASVSISVSQDFKTRISDPLVIHFAGPIRLYHIKKSQALQRTVFPSSPPWQPKFAVNVGLGVMAACQFPARELMAATQQLLSNCQCSSHWFGDLFFWKPVTIQGLWRLRAHLRRQP